MASLAETSRAQLVWTVLGLQLALFLAAMDSTIVATAMPRIVAQLAGFDRYAWTTTAYLLTSTAAVPIFGKLSDLYGRKRLLLIGIASFLATSALCGLAGLWPLGALDGMTQLIIARGLQGVAGGLLTSMVFTSVADLFPPSERGRYQGLFAGVWGLASVVGPALGGYLTDHFSWRWAFYLNLPVGLVALAVLTATFPAAVPVKRRAIDLLGAAALLLSLIPLLLALTNAPRHGWTSPFSLSLFGLGLGFGVAFVRIEQRVPEPLLPLWFFRLPAYGLSLALLFLIGVGMFGGILFVPLFAQVALGASATRAGSFLLPLMLGIAAASIVGGQIMSRTGRYKLQALIGFAVMTAAMAALAGLGPQLSAWQLGGALALLGLGLGTVNALYVVVVQNAVATDEIGAATASTQFARQIGGTVGSAVFGSLMLARYQARLGDLADLSPALAQVARDPLQLLGQRGALEARFGSLAPLFERTRSALLHGVSGVFAMAAALMLAGFLANFFLRETRLKTRADRDAERARAEHSAF